VNRTNHKRTEELAMEVLKDLKCLENAEFRCCWLAGEPRPGPKCPRELTIPAIYIKFDYPDAVIAPALCIKFATKGFATGEPIHDAKIKYVIREKVEKYLKMIGHDPGINTPQDMRLSEEFYA
jgi:hypothetical protein